MLELRAIGVDELLDQFHRVPRPGDHLVGVGAQFIALRRAQQLVDAARNSSRSMHALAGREPDRLLPPFAQRYALARDFRILRRHGDDVAPVDLGVEAKEQIGRGQKEEMQRVRLQYLAVMHQPAHLLGARRRRADDMIERLGGGDLVRHRADAAQPLHHDRRFPIGASLNEFLEAAKFDDVQTRLMNTAIVVQQQSDLAMTLDARNRIDGDAPQISRIGGCFQIESHGVASRLVRKQARRSRRVIASPRKRGEGAARAGFPCLLPRPQSK